MYTVAGHVLIQTTTDIYGGIGLRVVGLGRATKIVKTADSSYTNEQGETKKAVIVVKGFANLTLHGLTLRDDTGADDTHGVWFSDLNMTKFDIRDIYTKVGGYSLFVSGDMFINWLVNVQMEANANRPGWGAVDEQIRHHQFYRRALRRSRQRHRVQNFRILLYGRLVGCG